MKSHAMPNHWKSNTLESLQAPGDYAFVGGPFGSDLTSKHYVAEPGVPVIRGNNLGGSESRFVDDGFVFVSEAKAESLRRNLAHPGDLIFTQRGTLGQVAIIPTRPKFPEYVISQSQMKLTVDPSKADTRYVYYAFRSPQLQLLLKSRTQATGVPHINLRILKDFEIPLPPLSEQKRIADILDKADAIRRKREEVSHAVESFIPSLFRETFGEPNTNTKGWDIVPISEFVQSLEGGKNIKTDDRPSPTTRHMILKVSAVTWGDYRPHESKPVPPDFRPPREYFVRPGDLLMSRANTRELIGAAVYVDETSDNVILPDKIWRFVWKDPKRIEPLFVHSLLRHPSIRAEMGRRASGTSGSMKNIAKPKVLSIPVPLPPITLQRQFAEQVRSVRTTRERICHVQGETDALFQSLVQRAFKGEL